MMLPEKYLRLLLVICVLVAGCTSIHIYDKDSVTVTTKFGLTVIELNAKDDSALVSESKGFGIVSTPTGVTFGWKSELLAAIPEQSRCQAILWIETPEQLEAIQSLLRKNEKSLDQICIITRREHHEAY